MNDDLAPRFICDAMCGRLATWLRILGYDAEFVAEIEDDVLLNLAQQQSRVLLTRDTRLLARQKARRLAHLFVASDDFRRQLAQVIATFKLDDSRRATRCVRCNVTTEPVSRESVKRIVPPFVAEHQTSFRRCPACRRIYWPATHASGMQRELQSIFALADEAD